MAAQQVVAYVPDNGYRKRDERYADQCVHAAKPDPLWNKAGQAKKSKCFKPADFRLADDRSHCVCPAGKRLYSNGSNCTINGYVALKFGCARQPWHSVKRKNLSNGAKSFLPLEGEGVCTASGARNVCAHPGRHR